MDNLLTTESFFMTCKVVGLTLEDMELLTIGACLDYADDYLSMKQSDGKPNNNNAPVRKATQADFDNF